MRRTVSLSLTQLGTAAALLGALLLVPAPALAQDDVTHTLEARKQGKTASTSVTATAGQSASLSLKLASAPNTTAPVSAAPPPPETTGEPPPEPQQAPHAESHGRKGFFPWMTSTPGAMIGVGLTGVGLIGGGAFALGAKSSYDAANSVAAGIEQEAVQK